MLITPALAQNPVITGLDQNGSLSWSSSATSGYYTVQWAPSLTGAWHSTWSDLRLIPAAGNTNFSAEVPLYYRVTYTNPAASLVQVSGEVAAIGDGTTTTFSGTLAHHPVVPGSATFSVGPYQAIDAGNGALAGPSGAAGTIDYGTGAWSIDLAGTPLGSALPITADYQYIAAPP